jgi:hypothetical protein
MHGTVPTGDPGLLTLGIGLLGGLALFLFGMGQMADSLKWPQVPWSPR